MEKLIDGLLSQFERGALSRRQLVQALAMGAVAVSGRNATAAPLARPHPLKAASVNHISYGVSDYARTRDFYVDLLGMQVSEDTGQQCYLRFGDTLLTARKSRDSAGKPLIDHICFTLDDWDEGKVEAELVRRGLDPKADLGGGAKSFHIKDPDGYRIQLAPPLKPAT